MKSAATRNAYIATRTLDTPFWGLYNMLPFILYKDLHFSPMQLALLTAIKPMVSILSSYWSARVDNRPDRLVPSIILGRLLGYLPFFLFPFFDNAWFFILSYGLYMMMATANMPAWMELLKVGIPDKVREKVFSYTQAFGYMGGGLVPLLWGYLLDSHPSSWRILFPIAALFGLTSLFFQLKMKRPLLPSNHLEKKQSASWSLALKSPWQKMGAKLTENQAFLRYQIGFMFLGSALMVIQPALPSFFVDKLHLSYLDLGIAITLCKGLGFALSSPLWANQMPKTSLFLLSSRIAILGACFPLLLFLSIFNLEWLFFAYLLYGIMQSGSELVWNLSGPAFAGSKDSSPYSTVNVVAVGLRGCFIPALGALLVSLGSDTLVLTTSLLLFIGASAVFYLSRRLHPNGGGEFDTPRHA